MIWFSASNRKATREGEEQPVGGLAPEAQEEAASDEVAQRRRAGEEIDHRFHQSASQMKA